MKKYLNISEVSKILKLKEHVIRYWDSIDPKTNKLRIEGISTKSKGGTRYFNRENINKLEKLKNLLYENGDTNYTLKLADKFISSSKVNKNISFSNSNIETPIILKKREKFDQILKKMRILLKSKE